MTLFVAMLLPGFLSGQEFVTTKNFPDADSVVIEETERVRYNPDGTYEAQDETWTKILTEKGRREESSTRLDYSKRYGEGKIEYVGAIGTNGVERQIDVSATMKESTDNGAMSANIYDPLDRQIVCTIPGLKIGEIVHIKTRRKALKARCENKWADISIMEWTHPILKSTYEVTSPKELPIKKIAIRHPLGNIATNFVKNADGSSIYTFVATNSAQVFPEPDMPPLYTQVQNVRVSTAESWPEISKWYWNLCEPHLKKTNAAMKTKLSELLKNSLKMSREDKIRAIFKFVSQEVRYMGLTMEDTSPGYAPHDVDITFNNRYGVCRDKAGLLVAMLRLAKIEAFPVLIHVGAKQDAEVPQPFFNHAIVAVENSKFSALGSGKYQLMDPTNENTKDLFPSYLCDKSYLVCRPEGEELMTSPVPSPNDNELKIVAKGELSDDGSMFIDYQISMNGINDTAYRNALVKMKAEDRVKFFERVVKAQQSGAELVRCEVAPADMRDTEKPIAIKLAVRMPEMVIRGETQDELTLPFMTRGLGIVNFLLMGNTALVQRKYPLLLDTTARTIEAVKIALPRTMGKVKILPPEEKLGEGYTYNRAFAVENGVLTANREVTLKAVEFSPKQYGDLREYRKQIEAAERKRPIFARDRLADADVRYILDSTETTVTSDKEWVTTNTVIKEILTYNGKKRSAELKFLYNPTWKSVTVISATVSNRNGKVVAVTPKEMNVMDCGWAASAPRYPAGKMLVVNLPSVEIGSVVSYTAVVTVTNAPSAFYGSFVFDSHEPLDRKVVRVNDFSREVVNPKRLPNEPGQPAASFWRDHKIISFGKFEPVDFKVGADIHDATLSDLRAIRDWMAKYVKVLGPSLYELPLAEQLTDPQVVLKERYGTRLDYIRTMCALLRGAGFEADVVLAASDANEPDSVRRRIMFEQPNVRAFSSALCRVRLREGGFLGIGGEVQEIFLGTENQYAEIGATAFDGCDYFDPESGEFGIVKAKLADNSIERSIYTIREDGAVDIDVVNECYGTEVAGFRKTYSEILPEERMRRYQSILGAVSQAATATRDLETDVVAYPGRHTFSCYVPDYAVVNGDSITLQLPRFVNSIPSFTGKARKTPFAIGSAERESEEVEVRFPIGYAKIEHLPSDFIMADPLNPKSTWLVFKVSSKVENEALVVKLRREVKQRGNHWYRPEFIELINDFNRIANSRANCTITVRKGN